MDWGIVLSVLVAMILFTAGVGIMVATMAGLFVWRMKKRAGAHGAGGFKFPGCPLMKSAQNTQ